MALHVGIDTGGTFTDLVVLDDETGALAVGKCPSVPEAPADAIFAAFEAAGLEPAAVRTITLGTTIGTNALLERRGARVLYLTTAGFEDVPIIGRIDKKDPYDLQALKPEPLVSRRDCIGIEERVLCDGSIRTPLTRDELERLASRVETLLRGSSVDVAFAVSTLFSFANPAHERAVADMLRRRFPHVPVSSSSDVAPVWRELERSSTTIVNACLAPVVGRLAADLERGLTERGFRGSLSLMKSNGGHMSASTAGANAAETVLSGLSGGIVAGRHFGRLAGNSNVITFDMGGTSADIGVVRDGSIQYVPGYELEFGFSIATPAIDLVTLGSGGGSIAWVDEGGLLQVGPRSAGAVPGPACYAKGGTAPTVTDANVVLGRLDPESFLGGELPLDAGLAEGALAGLGETLGTDAVTAAEAVVEIATQAMASAIRRAAVERSVDPRDFQIVAFGGAGPLHAAEMAEALGIDAVLVPPHPGLASALGALLADRRVDRRWTQYYRSDAVDLAALDAHFAAMVSSATSALAGEGFTGEATVLRSLSMRYAGQNYEHDVPLTPGPLDEDGLRTALQGFEERHRQAYGFSFPGEAIELIHANVTAIGHGEQPRLPGLPSGSLPPPRTRADVWFKGHGWLRTPFYRRSELPADAELLGPAVITELDSTTLVLPRQICRVLPTGVLRLSSRRLAMPGDGEEAIDAATLSIVGDQLVQITQEMGEHMMRSAYSPIFSESRDFSCALFDRAGRMIAQGMFNPAHLGAIGETVRSTLAELEPASFDEGDVVVHNDPYRGGCHLPEHMLLAPIFHQGALVGFAATIGHMAEIGAVTVGSFASTATEVYQEGLRLPPVKLVRRGQHVDDVWRIILSNHRTPRSTWGDLHAMIGSLRHASRRVNELLDRIGAERALAVWDELLAHGARLMRSRIEEIPDGEYVFQDIMEGDGRSNDHVHMRVKVTINGDDATVDYTGSDQQARGPINATYGVAVSAAYNAFLQISGAEIPRNAGAYGCVKTIAEPGTVVNVAFPGPSVGGNTETQPKLVGMLLGAFAPALPELVMAAEGVTSCNFLFGGTHPATGEPYAHYHFEASGWGGRAARDGNSAQNHIHGNCRNTPVEVFETRYPFLTHEYALIPDSGGPGRRRGGLAVRRVLEVLAPEVSVSALMDRVEVGAWGLFGGRPGRCAAIRVRRAGEPEWRTFVDEFGTISPSKFAGVVLHRGDHVMIESAGGGGYGDPLEREPELVLADVADGLVTIEGAAADYRVVVTGSPERDVILDTSATMALRGGSAT